MKAILLSLILAVSANARVGETVEAFQKRAGVAPEFSIADGDVRMTVFKVDRIQVEVFTVKGVICAEVYSEVGETVTQEILAKHGRFTQTAKNEWTDNLKRLDASWSDYALTIRGPGGLGAINAARRINIAAPEKRTSDRF